jgi:hypothetical protein
MGTKFKVETKAPIPPSEQLPVNFFLLTTKKRNSTRACSLFCFRALCVCFVLWRDERRSHVLVSNESSRASQPAQVLQTYRNLIHHFGPPMTINIEVIG